jgi:hypothetical protein
VGDQCCYGWRVSCCEDVAAYRRVSLIGEHMSHYTSSDVNQVLMMFKNIATAIGKHQQTRPKHVVKKPAAA